MFIKNLFFYPIKSCQGIEVNNLYYNHLGPIFDRQWMIVDKEGKFLTQRKYPKMSLIQLKLNSHSLNENLNNQNIDKTNSIQMSNYILDTVYDSFTIKIENDSVTIPFQFKNKNIKIDIWGDHFSAYLHSEASEILSDYFKFPVNLVQYGSEARPKNKDGSETMFADKYPFLVVGTKSLEFISNKINSEISVQNFRPNIVVETNQPFEEDLWTRFQFKNSEIFEMVKPCVRCVMIDVDYTKGEKGDLPILKTLAQFREKVTFGMNAALHKTKQGRISVGDKISLLN